MVPPFWCIVIEENGKNEEDKTVRLAAEGSKRMVSEMDGWIRRREER